jgi:hypothetical protein
MCSKVGLRLSMEFRSILKIALLPQKFNMLVAIDHEKTPVFAGAAAIKLVERRN